ncbi:MAG: 2-amino-4-hydroxy-6-hydroxymethyldihydropteridine diphosphokinase [Lachnospiraceae bacterium]|nr:2-amino-4-hydroxy-6-hydroxymethyldihydropteridine diphosphokinase [Lachnospiraceae bacterium]
MDCIRIRNLEVFGHHGVYREENKLGQKFIVCADLYMDTRTAGLSDDIEQSVNYGEVCKLIDKHMREKTFYLIEAAAEDLAKAILLKFDRIERVELEVKKPWAPIGLPIEEVSVKIDRKWHDAYIGLGSNMGDKWDNINEALKKMSLDDDIKVIEVSTLIETRPYGYEEQDDFLNGAVHITTLYSPSELLKCLSEYENLAGRKREIHWGPRTLDLDILFYDDIILDTRELTIPHFDMINRDFVLKPLNEIAPWLRHPVLNKTVAQLYDEFKNRRA